MRLVRLLGGVVLVASVGACGSGTTVDQTDAMPGGSTPDAAIDGPPSSSPPDGAVAVPELKLTEPVPLTVAETGATLNVETTGFTIKGLADGAGVEVQINGVPVAVDPTTHEFSLAITLDPRPCSAFSDVQSFNVVARNPSGGESQKKLEFYLDVCPPVVTYAATTMYDELAGQGFLTTFAPGDGAPCLWRRNTAPAQVTFTGSGTPTIGKYHTNVGSVGGNLLYGGGTGCDRAPAAADATKADANSIRVAWNVADNLLRPLKVRTFVRPPGGAARPLVPETMVTLNESNPLTNPKRHEQVLVEEMVSELVTLPGTYAVWAEVEDSFGHVTTSPELTFTLALQAGPLAPPEPDNTYLADNRPFNGSLSGGADFAPNLSGDPFGIAGYKIQNRTQKRIFVDLGNSSVTLWANETRRRVRIDYEVSGLDSCPATSNPGAWSGAAPVRGYQQGHGWVMSVKNVCSSCNQFNLDPGQVTQIHPRVSPPSFISGFDTTISAGRVFLDNIGGSGYYPGTCVKTCLEYFPPPNDDVCKTFGTTWDVAAWVRTEVLTQLQIAVVEPSTFWIKLSPQRIQDLQTWATRSLATPALFSFTLVEDAPVP